MPTNDVNVLPITDSPPTIEVCNLSPNRRGLVPKGAGIYSCDEDGLFSRNPDRLSQELSYGRKWAIPVLRAITESSPKNWLDLSYVEIIFDAKSKVVYMYPLIDLPSLNGSHCKISIDQSLKVSTEFFKLVEDGISTIQIPDIALVQRHFEYLVQSPIAVSKKDATMSAMWRITLGLLTSSIYASCNQSVKPAERTVETSNKEKDCYVSIKQNDILKKDYEICCQFNWIAHPSLT